MARKNITKRRPQRVKHNVEERIARRQVHREMVAKPREEEVTWTPSSTSSAPSRCQPA